MGLCSSTLGALRKASGGWLSKKSSMILAKFAQKDGEQQQPPFLTELVGLVNKIDSS